MNRNNLRKSALALALILPFLALAQDGAPKSVTLEALNADLAAESSISDEERASLTEQLAATARDLEEAARISADLNALEAAVAQSDEQVRDYDRRAADIENAPATIDSRLGSNPGPSQIEGEISILESQRADWARDRTESLDQIANLARDETALRQRLSELNTQSEADQAPPNAELSPIAKRVRDTAIAARADRRAIERTFIELQLRSGADLNAIRTAKIRWLDAVISEADTLLTQLREAAAQSRESAGDQSRAETRRILNRLRAPRPEISDFADENLALVDKFQELNRKIDKTRGRVASARQMTERIEQEAQLTQRRLEVTGLEAELGDVMLSRLASLPSEATILRYANDRNQQIASVSSSAIDTEQLLRRLSDRQGYLESTVGSRDAWSSADRSVTDRLLDQRRLLVTENLQAENTLLRLLIDENQASEELANASESFRTLLTANLLWVRNYNYLRPASLSAQLKVLLELPDPVTLSAQWPLLYADLYLLIAVLIFAIVALRRRAATNALDTMLGVPIRPRDESVALILRGLALTLFVCLFLPLGLLIVGRALEILGAENLPLRMIGKSLVGAGVVLYVLNALQRLAGRLGVGRRLLKWNSPRADLILKDLNWFTPVFTIAVATQIFGRQISPTESGGALGALSSFTMASSLFVMSIHLLRSRQFGADWILSNALRAGALISLAIVIMHLSGQLFAAHLYLRALVLSIAAIIATLLLTSILQRFLVIYRMGLERKTREEQRAKEATATATSGEEPGPASEDEDALEAVSSLSAAYTQLLGLLRILSLGALLWLIWSPALPALTIFDSVVLWRTDDPSLPAGEMLDITLSVLLTALVVIAVTVLLTRHVPPLLNVLLMEWSTVSAGARYAAGMLLQYLIIGVGLSSALAMLGFQWSKVQWLVAALGVGIGFGLQEIVANFISGLIVLFERPIRVGDIINAGGHDGTVVNINPRATVIETFEGKEVMIPNKELITNTVTNWSLSSSKLRIVVPVGIAYGSDVDDATERLLRIAGAHPGILHDPEPRVTFEDFGDNALLLWLRCYALSDYLGIATHLRGEIYKDFNEAGIGIAFPQRDIHLDAASPLPIRILKDDES